jgi:glycosyltransferase involved in cell wall biosynthesis
LSLKKKFPISICMVVKNEEKRLDDALRSVDWAKEIVLIDDESTDRTIEVAKKYTDKIFERKMDIEGRQRNFSFTKASQEWILTMDADERVTPELAQSIQDTLSKPTPHNGYNLPVKTFIGKRWVKGAGYYPARKLRVFRKGKFQYEEARVHPRIKLDGTSGELQGDLLHYSCENFTQYITKFNRETSLEAEKWIRDNRKVSLPNILRKTVDRFIKYYFLKGGIQDGFLGYFMSTFHSLYQLHSYAKYWEMTQKDTSAQDTRHKKES